jgi:16S rRNA processing protein RimM
MTGAGDRVLLGEIVGVHGIKGDLIVRSYTEAPDAIGSYGALSDETGARSFAVTVIRCGPKGVVARIAGIDDRTAAEALRGTKLYVARAKLPAAADNHYYHADLIGLVAAAPDGQRIGRIVAVHNYGAGDFVEITTVEEQQLLVPFTDACIPVIDLDAGLATVIAPVDIDEGS